MGEWELELTVKWQHEGSWSDGNVLNLDCSRSNSDIILYFGKMLPLSIMGGKGTWDLSLSLLTTACNSKIFSNLKKLI